jgi:hypothetical protein
LRRQVGVKKQIGGPVLDRLATEAVDEFHSLILGYLPNPGQGPPARNWQSHALAAESVSC